MSVFKYQFDLPEELISKFPRPKQEHKILQAHTGEIRNFSALIDWLMPDDVIIANHTIVEHRRLFLYRQTGARVELLLLEDLGGRKHWRAMARPQRRLNAGEVLISKKNQDFEVMVSKKDPFEVFCKQPLTPKILSQLGQLPIPPYFKRESIQEDERGYQSVFGKELGSIAAPTSALHFDEKLISAIKKKGVGWHTLRLDIGYGTFAPLTSENFKNKKLHPEFYQIPKETAEILADKKRGEKGRIIALGTTTLRALETAVRLSGGRFDRALSGITEIFLHPPDSIQSVDVIITNFHLPQSSLLHLVSCFADWDKIKSAYMLAVEAKLQFFSYGDALWLENLHK